MEQNELDEVIHLSRKPDYRLGYCDNLHLRLPFGRFVLCKTSFLCCTAQAICEAAVRAVQRLHSSCARLRRQVRLPLLLHDIYSMRVRLAFVLRECSNYMGEGCLGSTLVLLKTCTGLLVRLRWCRTNTAA